MLPIVLQADEGIAKFVVRNEPVRVHIARRQHTVNLVRLQVVQPAEAPNLVDVYVARAVPVDGQLAVAAGGQGQDINPRTKYRIRDLQQQILDATDRQTALHRVLSGEDDGKPIPMAEMPPPKKQEEEGAVGAPPKDGVVLGEAKKVGEGGKAPSAAAAVKGAKDARIQALQEQLVANAKGFAAQISKLKLDIMQAEMGGGGGSDDDEDDEDDDDGDDYD